MHVPDNLDQSNKKTCPIIDRKASTRWPLTTKLPI